MSVFGNVLHVCAEELGWVSRYCGYVMGWMFQGFIPDSDSDFYPLQNAHTDSWTNPASYSGDSVFVPPELTYEPENSPLSIAKDKNEYSCTSAPLYAFMAWTETAVP